MNKKYKYIFLLLIPFIVNFSVFPAHLSLKRENIVLKYKYSNSFEKGTETVYCFKDKYCVRRYTELIEDSDKSLSESFLFPLYLRKNVKTAYRLIADEKYVYEINDLEKAVTRMKRIKIPEVSKMKKKDEKEFFLNQKKVFKEEIDRILFKKNPVFSDAFENVKKAKKILYFGKPCSTFTIMGAKFIYWEDVLLFREIPLEDKTKDVLEIESIDLNAKLDLSVFEIPSYYKIKEVGKDEFMSLIAENSSNNKILSEIEKNKPGFKL